MDETREARRWRKIEALFLAALDVDPRERRALLEERTDDPTIRLEVERMLAADARGDGLLDDPVAHLHRLESLLDRAPRHEPPTPETNPPSSSTPGAMSVPISPRLLDPPTPPAPPPPIAPVLEAGNLLADRFQIIRFLAAGGMGEVYEAEDLELGERVAIKMLRPELTTDPSAMERFRREVQLARRVTHPSVCRIYDIFHHSFDDPTASPSQASDSPSEPGADGEPSCLTFLSMELLSGETLAERIRRVDHLEVDEALPLVRQICAALASAHEVGIVHRDLKSSNILLVASPKGTRAVVTDFGLARLGGVGEGAGHTVTRTGTTLGTPAYMSPEQVRGDTLTSATDIYALGVLIYEMVTGKFPFAGDDSLVMAVRRLHEEPTSPRHHVPDLDPRWEGVILRCLRRRPADRFRTATEIVRYLESGSGRAFPTWRPRRLVPWVALPVLLLAGYLLPWQKLSPWGEGSGQPTTVLGAGDPSAPAAQGPVASRRSVAVLGFHNLTGQSETDWLSTAFSEMLTMELAAGEGLRTIPGENVARMRRDIALPVIASFAADTLARIRRHLGADLVVSGAYFATPEGERIRLDIRLEDTLSGRAITLFTEEGTAGGLLDLVARAGQRLRAGLELESPHASAVSHDLRAALPQRPEAARLFAQGVAKLRRLDALGALDLLEQAVRAEPDAPLAHAALANAWSALGHDARAVRAARRAFDLSGSLPRRERLQVEGSFRQASREWGRAIEIYSTLHTLYPDDLDYGLRLATVQSMGGRSDDALSTLDGLRRAESSAAEDPRIDLAIARAAEAVSDYSSSLEAARRAARQGEALAIQWLVAEARYLEGRALWRLGDLNAAARAAQEAEMLFLTLEDSRHRAESLTLLANISENQGERAVARELYEEALEIHRRIGHQPGIAAVLNNLAYVQSRLGDDQAALRSYEEALEIARAIDRKEAIARGLHNLGLLRRRQRQLDTSRQLFEQSLALALEIGNKNIESTSLNNLAGLARLRGEHDHALDLYHRSLELAREIGDKGLVASSLNNLGILNRQRGELSLAEQQLREARDTYLELGNRRYANRRLTSLAVIQIRRGQLERARRLLGDVGSALEAHEDERGRATLLEARAHLFLLTDQLERARLDATASIEIHRALGQETRIAKIRARLALVASAEDEHREAIALLDETARQIVQDEQTDDALFVHTALVEVLLAAEELEAAGRQVAATDSLASASGDFENRQLFQLATARLDLAAGRRETARERLEAVLAEVDSRGYALLQLEARALLVRSEVGVTDVTATRAALLSVIEEAESCGYRLLERRLRGLRSSLGD